MGVRTSYVLAPTGVSRANPSVVESQRLPRTAKPSLKLLLVLNELISDLTSKAAVAITNNHPTVTFSVTKFSEQNARQKSAIKTEFRESNARASLGLFSPASIFRSALIRLCFVLYETTAPPIVPAINADQHATRFRAFR